MKINIDSAVKKCEKLIGTKSGKKKYLQKAFDEKAKKDAPSIESESDIYLAAMRFIECIKKSAYSKQGPAHELGELGKEGVYTFTSMISCGEVEYIGGNKISIKVWFPERTRDSMIYDKEDGVKDIYVLLNDGYFAMNRVVGYWRGEYQVSIKERSPSHVIDDAIREFMDAYSKEYGIQDIRWVAKEYLNNIL